MQSTPRTTTSRRKRSLQTAFDNKENDSPTPPKKQRLFERRPLLKMNENEMFDLKENIRMYSVSEKIQQEEARDFQREMSIETDDDSSVMSFGDSSSVLSSTSSTGSQHAGFSVRSVTTHNLRMGSASSLVSVNSACSLHSGDSFSTSAMDETLDEETIAECADERQFSKHLNVPQQQHTSLVSFAMARRGSVPNVSSSTKCNLTIEPPQDVFIPMFPSASSNTPTGLSLCGPVTFGASQQDAQRTRQQQLDEYCISPGVLCSPTTFPLRYETVSDWSVPDTLNFISPQTMSKIMRENPRDLIVIDCRFPHEYDGGHIKGALNLYRPQDVKELLFDPMRPTSSVIVFHCEFSQKRGPKMYRFIRELDRQLHFANYPLVNYTDMYVLKGGFKAFHESGAEALSFCEPQGYIPMSEKGYENELKKSWREMEDAWELVKQGSGKCHGRRKVRRAKSAASLF